MQVFRRGVSTANCLPAFTSVLLKITLIMEMLSHLFHFSQGSVGLVLDFVCLLGILT